MQIGRMIINNMGASNPSIRLWLDVRFRGFWYVFIWRKDSKSYCYRSLDATPPSNRPKGGLNASDNKGKWYFGKRIGLAD
ncbi:MAG TPA: hypothetical protein VK619_10435 [Pyrinomonadaceae bacterium]|nr:hypothetical protein [Pyrinomonadaceae bacterium]